MESDKKKWKLGEVVLLPRKTTQINKKYEYLMASRYICIREATEGQRGILLRVLDKIACKNIIMRGGKPFCKDDKYEGLYTNTYFSYRFPSVNELKEVLDILKKDESLLEIFKKANMSINPDSTFWVRDTASRLFFLKKPQYYDASLGQLVATSDDETHHRLTIAYFYKSHVSW
jgi:hypothetical protein